MTTSQEAGPGSARGQFIKAEAEIRRMLGLWVSGLEPAIVYDAEHGLLGLTSWEHIYWGGVVPIIVEAWK